MMPLESLPIKGNLRTTIEDLPECIIQEIQSLLDRREGVFSCLLSKSWLHAWNTIPTLKFSEKMFNKLNPDRWRFDFVKVVDETMMRYQEQSLRIEKFSLCITTNKCTDAFVKKWLQIAVQSGLKELLLSGYSLVLPPVIFTCKTLETLTVVKCELKELDDHMIRCYSLLNLTLSSVHTNEQTIYKLFSNVPMIESITIYLCRGLKNIQVDNLGRLKRLDINNCYTTTATLRGTFECHSLTDLRLEYVHIHKDVSRNLFLNCPLIETLSFIDCVGLRKVHVANVRSLRKLVLSNVDIDQEILHKFLLNFPYIEDLSVRDCIDFTDVKVANIHYLMRFRYRNVVFEDAPSPCVFYICAAKYMKILKLHNLSVDDESLNKSISGFPILEQLTLLECNLLERIKISCQWLKDFRVKSCYKLIEVNFDTPRLRRLGFEDVMVPTLSFTNTSSTQLEIILNVKIWKHVSCFAKLRDLLMKSCRFALTIHVSNDDVATKIDLDHLRELITIPVKNVEELSMLMIYSNKHGEYSTILDALLSICRPKYARVWWFDFIEMGDFKEFLLRELVRKKGPINCCSLKEDDDKCWRHQLMDAEVILHKEGDAAEKRLKMVMPLGWKMLNIPLIVYEFRLNWLA